MSPSTRRLWPCRLTRNISSVTGSRAYCLIWGMSPWQERQRATASALLKAPLNPFE